MLLHTLEKTYPRVTILIEARDMWSLYFAQQNVDIKTVLLIDAGSWQNTFGSHTAQTVIASSPAAARALAVQATGHQARKVQPLLDSGVRKLYTLNW